MKLVADISIVKISDHFCAEYQCTTRIVDAETGEILREWFDSIFAQDDRPLGIYQRLAIPAIKHCRRTLGHVPHGVDPEVVTRFEHLSPGEERIIWPLDEFSFVREE